MASGSPFRRLVVPPWVSQGPPHPPEASRRPEPSAEGQGRDRDAARTRFRWVLWAELLRRVFAVDSLACPNCSGRMRVLAAILKAEGRRKRAKS